MKRGNVLPKIVSTASAVAINLEETGSSCHLKLPALQAEKQQAPRTATPTAAKYLPPIDADKGSKHPTNPADRPITRAQSRAQAPHDRIVPLPPLATDQKHAPPEQKLAKEKKPRRDRVGTAKPTRSNAKAAEKPRHLVPINHGERQDMASHVKDTEITNVSPASPYRVDGWSNSPKAPPMVPPLDLSTLNGPIGDAPMSAKRSSRGSSSSPIAASPDKWSNGLTSPEVLIPGLRENIHMVGLSPVAEDTGQDTPRPPVSSKRFYHVPRSPADKPEDHIPKPPSSPDKWSNGLTSPEVLIPGLGENIHMVGLSPVAEDTGQGTPRPPVSSKRFYHVPRSPADKPEDHIPKPPSSSRSGHISRNTASRMDEHIQGSSDLNSDRHVPHSPEHHTPHPPANRSGRSGEEQPQDRRRRFIRRR